jgi:D-xylose transport system substrate-binding protein
MRGGILVVATAGAVTLGGLVACGNNSNTGTGSSGDNAKRPFVGVILPDKTSARWEGADRRYLVQAFKDAGVRYEIQNAQGDKDAFRTIADQMLIKGVNVLVIVNLDSGTSKAVLAKAKQQGVATIDYDRLTLGAAADYYVSFDNVKVGELQGKGLQKCLADRNVSKPTVAELNGSPTDHNATLLAQGYNSVLNPLYATGTYTKGPNESVPDGDNTRAGTIFEQMLASTPTINGVLVTNDGMADSVISVLRKNHLNGKVPVTGQDATLQGLQHILDGDQCVTVYKAVKKEAKAMADLAVALAKGSTPLTSQTVRDPTSGRNVKAVLGIPAAIYQDNVKDVVADGYVSKSDLCAWDYAAKCTAAGIS